MARPTPGHSSVRKHRISFIASRGPGAMSDTTTGNSDASNSDAVFETVAELFSLLSTPIRLRIIGALCNQEKNVSQLLSEIDTTQPNMSQHLSTLYRAGVLGKRREGTQIYYRLESERVATLCRAVCTQVAIELDSPTGVDRSDRLLLRSAH